MISYSTPAALPLILGWHLISHFKQVNGNVF